MSTTKARIQAKLAARLQEKRQNQKAVATSTYRLDPMSCPAFDDRVMHRLAVYLCALWMLCYPRCPFAAIHMS
jgi:hypothetical protein